MSDRPRGDKTSKAQQEKRQLLLVTELQGNPKATHDELSQKLGVSAATVKRDLACLYDALKERSGNAVDDYREQQLAELSLLKSTLTDQSIKADRKVELALSIIDREMRLMGTEAPKRLLVGVGVTSTMLTKLQTIVSGMDQQQFERLIFTAETILTGEDQNDAPIEIRFIPPAGHEVPQMVLGPPQERKQLPVQELASTIAKVIDASDEGEQDWEAEYGELEN